MVFCLSFILSFFLVIMGMLCASWPNEQVPPKLASWGNVQGKPEQRICTMLIIAPHIHLLQLYYYTHSCVARVQTLLSTIQTTTNLVSYNTLP